MKYKYFVKLLPLLFSIIFVLKFNTSYSQGNKSTITDGDWSDPNIWSPSGVPTNMTDSLFISHSISFSGNKVINGADYVVIASSGCVFSTTANSTFAVIGTAKFISYGNFNVGSFSIQVDDSEIFGNVNADYIISFFNSTTLHLGSTFSCEYFLNKSRMVHESEVECIYMKNEQFLNGTGKFCIQDSLINTDTVVGTIKFSDGTPSGTGDDYYGYLGPSVIFNSAIVCNQVNVGCIGLGTELLTIPNFYVYPNPASDLLYVSENELSSYFEIYNFSGSLVKNGFIEDEIISISELPNGVYLLRINGKSERIVKN